MQMITAFIKPHKPDDVRQAPSDIGVQGLSVSEAKGYGRQKGHKEHYRGAEYVVDFVPKGRLEVAVTEDRTAEVVRAISGAARTGKIGDGKIFVHGLTEVVRLRTEETDRDAL
jgi:nitrogen regulatory protein PII